MVFCDISLKVWKLPLKSHVAVVSGCCVLVGWLLFLFREGRVLRPGEVCTPTLHSGPHCPPARGTPSAGTGLVGSATLLPIPSTNWLSPQRSWKGWSHCVTSQQGEAVCYLCVCLCACVRVGRRGCKLHQLHGVMLLCWLADLSRINPRCLPSL